MKKTFLFLTLTVLSVVAFGAPQLSGKADYIMRYTNGELIQEIRNLNSSTISVGDNFVGKISFSLYESNAIADNFAKYVHAPILSQSSMAKLVFNEFYLQYEGKNVEITAGKYYTGWGTSPLANPIDLLSPYDFTNAFDSPTKLSVEGVKGVGYFGNSQVELNVVPEFSPDLHRTVPATFENVMPKPENMQLGARYQTNFGDYSISIDAYHGFVHAYVPMGGILKHPPLTGIGGEFSGPLPFDQNYGFYGEGMYLFCGNTSNTTGLIGVNGFGGDYNWGMECSKGLPGQSPFDLEDVLTLYGTKNFTSEISSKAVLSFGKDGDSYGAFTSAEMDFQPVQNLNLSVGLSFAKGLKGTDYFKTSEKMNSLYAKGTVYF